MPRISSVMFLLVVMSSLSWAASLDDEIAYLLNVQAGSDCTFIRNDISYNSDAFNDHLQSKIRNNEEVIDSTEEFIEKIATRSATSNSPYVALCDGQLTIVSDWFTELLMAYRQNN
ncbi:MAG: hypothetical protein GKR91_06435 [Pseudomonadales bacterium]|nr:hypothetical protein [Pseudomonadales bacterium]